MQPFPHPFALHTSAWSPATPAAAMWLGGLRNGVSHVIKTTIAGRIIQTWDSYHNTHFTPALYWLEPVRFYSNDNVNSL